MVQFKPAFKDTATLFDPKVKFVPAGKNAVIEFEFTMVTFVMTIDPILTRIGFALCVKLL